MYRLLRLIACVFLALAINGNSALADDLDPEPDTETDSSTDDSATETKPDGETAPAGMSLADYPQRRIDRPRVLPNKVLQAHAELGFTRVDLAGSSTSFTVLNFGGAVGLMEGKLEAGLITGIVLDPDTDLTKQVQLHGAYVLKEQKKWAVAGELKITFDFNDGADTFAGFSLGGRGIYRLNDKMAILGGQDFVELSGGADDLNINLNIGFLYQFTPKISAEAHTQIASLAVAGDLNDTTVIFADATPLTLTGYWSMDNKLDAWLGLAIDINNIGDAQQILVGIAYRFGL